MIIPAKTIPSSFVRFDTGVSAADRWVNVRDLHVARENANILMARGNVMPIAMQRFHRTGGVDGFLLAGLGSVSPDGKSGTLFWRTAFDTPHDKFRQFRLTVSAWKETSDTPHPSLYFVVSPRGSAPLVGTSNQLQITATSASKFSLTIDSPPATSYYALIYVETPLRGSDAHAATAISQYGPGSFVYPSTASGTASWSVAHFDDPAIAPKLCYYGQFVNGGADFEYYFAGGWDKEPDVDTTTVAIRLPNRLHVESLTIEAVYPTTFGS